MRRTLAFVLALGGCLAPPAGNGGGDGGPTPDLATGGGSPDLGGEAIAWDPMKFPWPMFGHDARRTGRSPLPGPATHTPASAKNWSYTATGGALINMQPTVTGSGVYFGTWGVFRGSGSMTRDQWVKMDGKYYGLALDAPAAVLPGFDPRPTPYCYRYPSRPTIARDKDVLFGCGGDNGLALSFYNGTVEGTALVDPLNGLHYVGRGDGNLYAIDPSSGQLVWTFRTFNPELADDPDGGGEVVGGALMDRKGRIYFATFGAPLGATPTNPLYETHAVYAVDRAGQLVWRYPTATARVDGPFRAATALSPDGTTVYAATFLDADTVPGRLLALDADTGGLRWEWILRNPAHANQPMWATHLSVGPDGTIYVGGLESATGYVPMVAAVDPDGMPRWIVNPQGHPTSAAQWTQGLALWEDNGAVARIYASTATSREFAPVNARAALFALDPSTGATASRFDPPAAAIGGMTAPTLDANERVYAGTRGQHDTKPPEDSSSLWRPGVMFGLSRAGAGFTTLWSDTLTMLLDWAHPAIGLHGALYFGSSDLFHPNDGLKVYQPSEVAAPHRDPKLYAIFE